MKQENTYSKLSFNKFPTTAEVVITKERLKKVVLCILLELIIIAHSLMNSNVVVDFEDKESMLLIGSIFAQFLCFELSLLVPN